MQDLTTADKNQQLKSLAKLLSRNKLMYQEYQDQAYYEYDKEKARIFEELHDRLGKLASEYKLKEYNIRMRINEIMKSID